MVVTTRKHFALDDTLSWFAVIASFNLDIGSASCRATARLAVFPRHIAQEISFVCCLIIANTLGFLVFHFPLKLRMDSHANSGV